MLTNMIFDVNSVWWMEAIVILFLVQHRFGNVQKYFLIIFFLQRESFYNVALQEVSIYLYLEQKVLFNASKRSF